MNITSLLWGFFPLQSYKVTDFWKSKYSSSGDAILFVVGIGIVIIAFIIVNIMKKKSPVLNGNMLNAADAITAPRRFSGITLHRLARSLGLNRDQTKMLDYVLKTDGVTDPRQSINTPALMDQHFRKAYRAIIENGADNEDEVQERLAVLFATRNALESNSGGSSLSSTRQVPDNSSAMLNIEKETFPVRVISAKGESLEVECPCRPDGSPVQLSIGSKLNITFLTRSSTGFSFETRVLKTDVSSKKQTLHLVHSNQIKRLTQRRFKRRQAVIAADFYLVNVEESDKGSKKLVVDKRRQASNIMDISVGGCSIKTNAPVNSGARLKIEFLMGSNAQAAALGQVLRINRTGISTILHTKFLKVPRKSMNLINGFIYEYLEI